MDPILYLAAKAKGQASITPQGETTLLVSVPGGYSPETGDPKPPIERGYQPQDLIAMRETALVAVDKAEEALINARNIVAAWDEVLATEGIK